MKRTAVCLAGAVACFLLALTSPASADHTVVLYEVTLDAVVFDMESEQSEDEGHAGAVHFDGLPEIVENDLVPPPPFLPGNDLIFTEGLVANPDGTATIFIWIEGDGPEGAPLFVNPLDFEEDVLLDFGGVILSDDSSETEVIDGEIFVAFGDVEVEIEPLFFDIFGDGTDFDPLGAILELDPWDFYLPAGDPEGMRATGLHLSVTIDNFSGDEIGQFSVPEPSTLLLVALAVPGLLACRRRRRA